MTRTTIRSWSTFKATLCVLGGVLAATAGLPATAATWTGGNFDWTNPDNDSFGAPYSDGNPADFLGAGTGTITVAGGGVNPSAMNVNATSGNDYEFTGGAISGPLSKLGDNTLTLRAANGFSSVDSGGGTIDFDDNDRLGSGTINYSADSRLLFNKPGGNDTFSNPMTIANDVTATFQFETNGLTTLNGAISGGTLANPVTVIFSNQTAAGGTGSFDQIRLSTSNTFVGEFQLRDRATLNMTGDGNFGDPGNSIRMAGLQPYILMSGNTISRDIQFDGQGFFVNGTLSGQLSGGGGIRINGGTVAITNTLNAGTLTGNYEMNTGTLQVSAPEPLGTGTIVFVNTQRTLQIIGTPGGAFANAINNASNPTLANPDAILDVVNANAVIDWTGNLGGSSGADTGNGFRTYLKTGAGTFNVANTNFTGAWDVQQGTLNMNDPTTSVQQAYEVGPAGTLGGTGTITLASAVNVTVDGTLAPGSGGPGTLSIVGSGGGGLVINPGATLAFELDQQGIVGSGINDLVEVDGDLTLDGTLSVIAGSNFGIGVYRLFNYTGTLIDNGLFVDSPVMTIDTSTPGQVNLVVIPEPATFTFVGLAGGAAFVRRRRIGRARRELRRSA